MASLSVIQNEIGQKVGETLKEQARGIDRRPLNFHHERKSVSAEVNYGIRFKTLEECHNFLQSLSNEVYNRLNDIGMRARCVTLKLLIRAADAPVVISKNIFLQKKLYFICWQETAKFLGCGVCDSLTKSTSNVIINDPQAIYREVKNLYDKLNPPFVDLRGIGIQLTKLGKNAPMNKAMSNFLKQATKKQSETERGTTTNADRAYEDKSKDILENKKMEVAETVLPKVDNSKSSSLKREVTKSTRGRPKGEKTSANKQTLRNTASTSLNKFFMKDKGVENHRKVQKVRN